jgi:hypothetical protein
VAVKSILTIFVHIPRTGGTTLHNILSRIYPEKDRLHIHQVKTPLKKIITQHTKPASPFLIQGHMDITDVLESEGNFTFTFLREPVSRVLSHYHHLKETPSRHFEYLNRAGTTIESFYALKEKNDIDNGLTRYIGGFINIPFGEINETHYLKALENLKHKINFFGIQEYYNESLILLATKLGWPLPLYRKKNVSKEGSALNKETHDFLREANRWDVLLFEKAKEIFVEQIKAISAEEKKKLARLRLLNRLASLIP